jgi:hypothetical protein
MLIEDWRPKLYCKNVECQNLSPNKKVFFIEEGHKYYHENDIVNGKITPFENSEFKFKSPTGIIGDLYEHFDVIPQAKKYVKKHELPITWEQLVYAWEQLGLIASEEGTILHGYGEALFNNWPMEAPTLIKQPFVHTLYKELLSKYTLAKTELLVYSTRLRLAGQVDLLMKNKDGSEYYILDYKFLNKPIEKKSFFNWGTKKFKMMKGPFKHLMDCNFIHYSIQMELYRYLMGSIGNKVKNKTLMVVTTKNYELVEGHPIKIWFSADGVMHAKYRHYKNKLYDSSKDNSYLKNTYKIL